MSKQTIQEFSNKISSYIQNKMGETGLLGRYRDEFLESRVAQAAFALVVTQSSSLDDSVKLALLRADAMTIDASNVGATGNSELRKILDKNNNTEVIFSSLIDEKYQELNNFILSQLSQDISPTQRILLRILQNIIRSTLLPAEKSHAIDAWMNAARLLAKDERIATKGNFKILADKLRSAHLGISTKSMDEYFKQVSVFSAGYKNMLRTISEKEQQVFREISRMTAQINELKDIPDYLGIREWLMASLNIVKADMNALELLAEERDIPNRLKKIGEQQQRLQDISRGYNKSQELTAAVLNFNKQIVNYRSTIAELRQESLHESYAYRELQLKHMEIKLSEAEISMRSSIFKADHGIYTLRDDKAIDTAIRTLENQLEVVGDGIEKVRDYTNLTSELQRQTGLFAAELKSDQGFEKLPNIGGFKQAIIPALGGIQQRLNELSPQTVAEGSSKINLETIIAELKSLKAQFESLPETVKLAKQGGDLLERIKMLSTQLLVLEADKQYQFLTIEAAGEPIKSKARDNTLNQAKEKLAQAEEKLLKPINDQGVALPTISQRRTLVVDYLNVSGAISGVKETVEAVKKQDTLMGKIRASFSAFKNRVNQFFIAHLSENLISTVSMASGADEKNDKINKYEQRSIELGLDKSGKLADLPNLVHRPDFSKQSAVDYKAQAYYLINQNLKMIKQEAENFIQLRSQIQLKGEDAHAGELASLKRKGELLYEKMIALENILDSVKRHYDFYEIGNSVMIESSESFSPLIKKFEENLSELKKNCFEINWSQRQLKMTKLEKHYYQSAGELKLIGSVVSEEMVVAPEIKTAKDGEVYKARASLYIRQQLQEINRLAEEILIARKHIEMSENSLNSIENTDLDKKIVNLHELINAAEAIIGKVRGNYTTKIKSSANFEELLAQFSGEVQTFKEKTVPLVTGVSAAEIQYRETVEILQIPAAYPGDAPKKMEELLKRVEKNPEAKLIEEKSYPAHAYYLLDTLAKQMTEEAQEILLMQNDLRKECENLHIGDMDELSKSILALSDKRNIFVSLCFKLKQDESIAGSLFVEVLKKFDEKLHVFEKIFKKISRHNHELNDLCQDLSEKRVRIAKDMHALALENIERAEEANSEIFNEKMSEKSGLRPLLSQALDVDQKSFTIEQKSQQVVFEEPRLPLATPAPSPEPEVKKVKKSILKKNTQWQVGEPQEIEEAGAWEKIKSAWKDTFGSHHFKEGDNIEYKNELSADGEEPSKFTPIIPYESYYEQLQYGYKLRIMSPEVLRIERDSLYVNILDDAIEYHVKDVSGKDVTGRISFEELELKGTVNLDKLRKILPKILAITAEKGDTRPPSVHKLKGFYDEVNSALKDIFSKVYPNQNSIDAEDVPVAMEPILGVAGKKYIKFAVNPLAVAYSKEEVKAISASRQWSEVEAMRAESAQAVWYYAQDFAFEKVKERIRIEGRGFLNKLDSNTLIWLAAQASIAPSALSQEVKESKTLSYGNPDTQKEKRHRETLLKLRNKVTDKSSHAFRTAVLECIVAVLDDVAFNGSGTFDFTQLPERIAAVNLFCGEAFMIKIKRDGKGNLSGVSFDLKPEANLEEWVDYVLGWTESDAERLPNPYIAPVSKKLRVALREAGLLDEEAGYGKLKLPTEHQEIGQLKREIIDNLEGLYKDTHEQKVKFLEALQAVVSFNPEQDEKFKKEYKLIAAAFKACYLFDANINPVHGAFLTMSLDALVHKANQALMQAWTVPFKSVDTHKFLLHKATAFYGELGREFRGLLTFGGEPPQFKLKGQEHTAAPIPSSAAVRVQSKPQVSAFLSLDSKDKSTHHIEEKDTKEVEQWFTFERQIEENAKYAEERHQKLLEIEEDAGEILQIATEMNQLVTHQGKRIGGYTLRLMSEHKEGTPFKDRSIYIEKTPECGLKYLVTEENGRVTFQDQIIQPKQLARPVKILDRGVMGYLYAEVLKIATTKGHVRFEKIRYELCEMQEGFMRPEPGKFHVALEAKIIKYAVNDPSGQVRWGEITAKDLGIRALPETVEQLESLFPAMLKYAEAKGHVQRGSIMANLKSAHEQCQQADENLESAEKLMLRYEALQKTVAGKAADQALGVLQKAWQGEINLLEETGKSLLMKGAATLVAS